jgi:hypothetical protein
MTSPAILARLNPANVRFDTGKGGIAELTQTDIAAALAMSNLPDGAYYFARAKFCGDASMVSLVEAALWGAVVSHSINQGWQVSEKTPTYLRKMAILGCAEILSHGKCRKCKGRGNIQGRGTHISPTDKIYECPSCDGSGIGREISGRARARFFGMDERAYRDRWHDRYRQMLSVADEWTELISAALKKQLEHC